MIPKREGKRKQWDKKIPKFWIALRSSEERGEEGRQSDDTWKP